MSARALRLLAASRPRFSGSSNGSSNARGRAAAGGMGLLGAPARLGGSDPGPRCVPGRPIWGSETAGRKTLWAWGTGARRGATSGAGPGGEGGVSGKANSPPQGAPGARHHEDAGAAHDGTHHPGGPSAGSEGPGASKQEPGPRTLHDTDKYVKSRKALGALMRKRIQPGLEAMIDYVNTQSGWTEVNKLKNEITELERQLLQAQTDYKTARMGLSSTSEEHRRVQAELNSLSLTKHSWTDEQFQYYQQLLATDRSIGNKMAMLDMQTKRGEERVDRTLRELMEGLRRRFHEEQLWTERIRMLSMWSTIAILTANSLIFLVTFLMRSRESAYIRTAVKKIREDLEQQADMKQALASLQGYIEKLEQLHMVKSRKSAQEPPAPAPAPDSAPSPSGASDAAAMFEKEMERRAAVGWYVAVALAAGWLFGRAGGGS